MWIHYWSHLIPQGRLFSYDDTHYHRLGANFQMIPVNCPYAGKPRNYVRDGPMCVDGNQGKRNNNYFYCFNYHSLMFLQVELPIIILTASMDPRIWENMTLQFSLQ